VVVVADANTPPHHLARLKTAALYFGTTSHVVFTVAAAVEAIERVKPERVRVLSDALDTEALQRVAHQHGAAIDRTPPLGHGRVELGRWCKEQSISVTAHRHGRLISNMTTAIGASLRAQ
jgi:hypothetical protein